MTLLVIILITLLTAGVQARLPTMWWAGGLRLELLPGLVACWALWLNRGPAVFLAIVCALAQDSLSGAPFGISVLPYTVVTLLFIRMRGTLDRDLLWVPLSAGALASAAASLAACITIGFSPGMLGKTLLLASISGVLTLFLFPLMGLVVAKSKVRSP